MRIAALFLILSFNAFPAIRLLSPGVRQIEDGPPAPPGTQFVPGETVYYSVQAADYGIVPGAPDQRKVRLSYRIGAFDPKGVTLIEPVESVLDTTISEQDKEWKPKVRAEIAIPPFAPPGKYKVVATVTDDVAKVSATAETFFEVSVLAVQASPELTVRNFGFYRSDEEQKPLEIAAYRAGDNLFARFDMTGFRYGDRNTIELTYDVAVENPDGKLIYSQPSAATEKSFSFYPKPFVPGGMNLSLQSDMRKGKYTVVLTVHDVLGHQDYVARQSFEVE